VRAEADWLPVLRGERRAGDVRFQFEAVAAPEPGRRDSGLLVSMQVRAANLGALPVAVRLEVALAARRNPIFVAADAPETLRTPLRWDSNAGAALVEGWADVPAIG